MREQNDISNVKYQISFLIKLSIILVISSIISGVIFHNFVSYPVGESYATTRFVIKSVKDFLVPSLWFSITIFTLLFSLGTIIISILVSHRIAGPLYRLESTFTDFKEGIFYNISIRPKDQIQAFVKYLNGFVDSLSENFSSAKRDALHIKVLMDKTQNEINRDEIDYQQVSALNDELQSRVNTLKQTFANYKTE